MNLLHRLALCAWPRAFREEFGAEMERVFEDRVRGGAARSRVRRATLALFLAADTVVSGLGERIRGRRERAFSGPRGDFTTTRSEFMTWQSIRGDVVQALRQFRAAPVFALLTVATLAVGIGANTAVFAVVQSVLLEPLPYRDAGELVAIWSDNTNNAEKNNPVSPANYEAFRAAPSLERVEGMYSFLTNAQVLIGGEPEPVVVSQVTPGMIRLLGREPLLGRTFEDAGVEGAILSYRFWQRRFGGDPEIAGRTLSLSGGAPPIPVLGVMPADFTFPYGSMLFRSGFARAQEADMWWPISRTRDSRLVDASGQPNRRIHYFAVIGRMQPGATLERVRADLDAIAAQRAADFPDTNQGWGVTVRPLHEQTVGSIRPAVILLFCGVGVVLMITCFNVANVLLARAAGRGQEFAVRSALGAPRRRLIQQALFETVVLSLAGGLAGMGVMILTVRAIVSLAPAGLPRIGEVAAGTPVVVFGFAIALATGLAVGLVPAVTAGRSRAHDSLRAGSRTTASRARRRVRAALIVAQVALAMVLTISGGLLLRSFVSVLQVDPGFNPEQLLTMQISVPARNSDTPSQLAFYDQLESRLKALPGVTAVGGTTRLPLGSTNVTTVLEIEGRPAVSRAELPEVEMRRAVFDYFTAMEIPLRRGRAFTRDDHADAPPVVVVNSTLVSRLFPGEDPIGKRVKFASPTQPWMTIVGVVGDIRHGSLEELPRPELYIYYRQGPPVSPFVVVRASAEPEELSAAVRQAVRDLGANPPRDVRTMEAIRSASVESRRFVLLLVGVFGVLALSLAALGVFGVITLIVAERTSEVGIRLALGASPSQILRLLLNHAVRLTGAGVLIGIAAALGVAPLIRAQLFGVPASDPLTYAVVAVLLMLTAAVAAWVPARRAMKVDPATALRV